MIINNNDNNNNNNIALFYSLPFSVKICWNSFCFFYNFITRNHLIVNNTS